jgi:hypothetical protein
MGLDWSQCPAWRAPALTALPRLSPWKLTLLPTSRRNSSGSQRRKAVRRRHWCKEVVERFVDYDEWSLREVEAGLAAADRGEFVDHEDVGKMIDRRYPG